MSHPVTQRVLPIVLLLALAAAPAARRAQAQATGTPTFFAPTRGFGSTEAGVSVSGGGSSDVIGVEARYGFSLNRSDVALRGGYVDGGSAGSGSFVAGVEVRLPVIGHDRDFPLDGAFIFGVGHHFADGGGETLVPLGLTLGRRIRVDDDALQITPYVQPTVVFQSDAVFGFGLGLDVHIQGIPEIRLNWAEGDLDGFSASLFWGR
ncbi:MAG: hypothetical protein OEZ65_00195 [Gemmatimonadota bacterium]|nr:hypothetical protein [Gemmatimonadota bacterium]MDH5757972.1 hypothetical protein [Gemmatimonadota bacterium]